MHGVHGQYLRVDLAQGKGEAKPLDDGVYRQWLGGVGLGVWLLLGHSEDNYDPLGPSAPVVVSFAPLVGSRLNTSAKAAVICKSPLTGRLNDALISSGFALTGKATGYDAFVIQGSCSQWSTLCISPEGVELLPCPDIKGLSAEESEAALHEQLGKEWQIAAIGLAGENLIPYATLSHDGRHAGRGGTGAVLGAKRLKAIAVKGDVPTSTAHPEALEVLRQGLKKSSLGPGTEKYRTTGTMGNLLVFDRIGVLPTRNFQQNASPNASKLSAEKIFQSERVTRTTCADCMIGCEKRLVLANGESTRLEYENIFSLGALNEVWEMETVAEASRICDYYGLDTITYGGTLSFLLECVERGLFKANGLRFGDGEALVRLIGETAQLEGIGRLLALGSRKLAHKIAQNSLQFAPQIKGMEMPGYHPGGAQTLALGLAVGTRGADHNKSAGYDLDFSGTVDRHSLDEARIADMIELEDQAALMDSLILCKFIRRAMTDLFAESAEMLRLLTGVKFDVASLQESAKSIHHLKKIFNQRQGWDSSEDILPERFFHSAEPKLEETPEVLNKDEFLLARTRYYLLRGWSTEGCFTGVTPPLPLV